MIVTVWPFPTHKRMTVFTVHEPPSPPADRVDRAEALVFLKDGFNWSAFLLGPVWLLANRLWLATLGYVAIATIGYLLFEMMSASEGLFGPFLLALNVIAGFEAHWLNAAKLEAREWNTLGSVSGQSLAECERRFFEGWLPTQTLLRRDGGIATSSAAPHDRSVTSPEHQPAAGTRTHAGSETKPKDRLLAYFRRSREG